MDERLTAGLIFVGAGVLYFNGTIPKAWNALWGHSAPLGAAFDPSQASGGGGAAGGGSAPPAGNPGASPAPSGDATPWGAVGDLAAGRIGVREYANLCLAWAQNQAISAGVLSGHRYGSALQAENAGPLNASCNAPKGAFVWFNQSWDPNAHVGISEGDGTMVSALPGGVQRQPFCVNGFIGWSAPR